MRRRYGFGTLSREEDPWISSNRTSSFEGYTSLTISTLTRTLLSLRKRLSLKCFPEQKGQNCSPFFLLFLSSCWYCGRHSPQTNKRHSVMWTKPGFSTTSRDRISRLQYWEITSLRWRKLMTSSESKEELEGLSFPGDSPLLQNKQCFDHSLIGFLGIVTTQC